MLENDSRSLELNEFVILRVFGDTHILPLTLRTADPTLC